MQYRDTANLGSVDNSEPQVKRALREQFIRKVGATLCFDLFCGHGTYCRELYRDHFGTVVCVDQKADALADLPPGDHVKPYRGNNASLVLGLLERYGWPDFWDLDAYGNPEAPLVRALALRPTKDRFAIVATDGTLQARKRSCRVPRHWGYGKDVRWAPNGIERRDYSVLILDNLRRWLGAVGYEVAEFEYRLPRGNGKAVVYWGSLAVRVG